MSKQSNQYDKILRENLEAFIPGLIENVLGLNVVASEELPDDVQHTKERKPDALKKITDDHGNTAVLQIEFQVADEPEMVYRMAEYYIMLERKYKLPVRQFVIFLGSSTPQMPVRLDSPNLTFTFPLISFATLDYRLFLNSTRPEEVLLSILANFSSDSTDTALQQIVRRVEETSAGDFSLRKHINQLRVLAQLRNLGVKLKSAMDSIAQFISPEKDAFYLMGEEKGEQRGREQGEQKGREQGREQAKESFVYNLFLETDMTTEQIAKVADVSIAFVDQVRQKVADS